MFSISKHFTWPFSPGVHHCPSLWAGTNAGHIYLFYLTVPGAEKRSEDEVQAEMGKEIKLKHKAPVVSIFVVDKDGMPLFGDIIQDQGKGKILLSKCKGWAFGVREVSLWLAVLWVEPHIIPWIFLILLIVVKLLVVGWRKSRLGWGGEAQTLKRMVCILLRRPNLADVVGKKCNHSFFAVFFFFTEADMSGTHSLVICSEEQFKVFSLPHLKARNKEKLTAVDGSRVRKIGLINVRSKNDDSGMVYHCLACVSNQGDLIVYSVPNLKVQVKASAMRKSDVDAIKSLVFSVSGQGFYLSSRSEMQRFTLSATDLWVVSGKKNFLNQECSRDQHRFLDKEHTSYKCQEFKVQIFE